MNNKLIVGMVIVFVVFSVFQMIQINSLKNSLVNGASTGSTKVSAKSSGGESYEEMMARMHPEQYAANKRSGSTSNNAPSMVGGC